MVESLRWWMSSLLAMGWPALLVLAAIPFERLVFLRGQPQRRPVLGWYLSIWFIGNEIVTLLSTPVPGGDAYEWPAAPGYVRPMTLLLWITLLSIGEMLSVQGWALWKKRSALPSASESSLPALAPRE